MQIPTHKAIQQELQKIADKFNYTTLDPPFKGHNFVTSFIVQQGRLINGIWFELSYGRNMTNDGWFYGITLIDKDGNNLEDIQGLCYTFKEVEIIMQKAEEYYKY